MCDCQTFIPKQAAYHNITQTQSLWELWFWFTAGNSHCQGPGSSLNLPYPWNSHRRWQCVSHLNKTTTNMHGSNIVNSAGAGGVMVQEVKPGWENPKDRTLPIFDKSHQRSLKVDTPETPPPPPPPPNCISLALVQSFLLIRHSHIL